jgi:hypothetical protein
MMPTRIQFAGMMLAVSVAACRPQTPPAPTETPTLDVTDWTARTELFMEYPPLVAGKAALFAVHLTQMADFKPVTAGQATVEFAPESGGAGHQADGSKRPRPGAFRVEGAPPAAGRYRWAPSDARDSRTATISDRHGLPRRKAAPPTRPGSRRRAAAIAYLKEQWTNPRRRWGDNVRTSISTGDCRCAARWKPSLGAGGRMDFLADALRSATRVSPGRALPAGAEAAAGTDRDARG